MSRNRRFMAALSVMAIVAFGGATRLLAGVVSVPAEELSAPLAGVAGNGHAQNATGGYHFTIDPNFNGGIFGTITPIENRLTFNARRDADGSVSGWYNYEQASDGNVYTFSGPVTCLNVYDTPVLERFPGVPAQVQNRAKWGGLIAASNDPTLVGSYIWFNSIDNGEGANGWTDISSIPGIGNEAANEAFCASNRVPNARFGPHPIGGGNVQVH